MQPVACRYAPEVQTVPTLLGLFLPSRCAGCEAWGSGPWCKRCDGAIRWIGRDCCSQCGIPAPAAAGTCRACHYRRFAFVSARSAAVYAGPAREAVKTFKLMGERRAARALAARMVEGARALGGGVVTWVPSTRASEASRGFNPAEELARPLARSLRLPAHRLLTKQRDTLDSAGLSKEQRRVNLLHAFTAKRPIAGNVVLVDDIFTTGATADECAKALRRAGAREVSVVTFARAI